ncbi:phosphotransferase family protein [Nocardia sp. alder85J]|uniref:phosphotransferase family protein n=1 Tax=Nocardia sp. alder85J TaxID=2862949 RepID=UPI001CD6ACBB|nr:phosphotransferase family protein [Nocardia sp. alder85J]MCX4090874.1 phosphotransferase family protein [Nocardia sp. alder85J]
MKQAPVFSKGRDLDATATALRAWLAARLDVPAVEIDRLDYPRGAGISNETILIRVRHGGTAEELVLRIAPAPEFQMFFEPKFRIQYDILVALRQHGDVRVPEALWFEEDPGPLGRPFYLMRRMTGRVPVSMPVYNREGWLADATPEQRRVLWDSAVEQLAAVTRVPVAAVPFVDRPEHGPTGDEQQLTYWQRYIAWALGDDVPATVRTLMGWLTENRPAGGTTVLSWGDARMGNIMFGDDFRVVGVMDWEQAALTDPAADLAWWLLFDEMHSTAQDVARLPGLGTRAETIDRWQRLTGLRADNLLWHEVFAGLKAGLLSLHTGRSLRLPSVKPRRGPYIPHVCRLLGLPDPEDL